VQEAGKRASDLRHDIALLMKQSNASAAAAVAAPPQAELPVVRAPDVYTEGSDGIEVVHSTLKKILDRLQETGVTEAVAQSSVRQAAQISSQAQTV
jgi:ABC-type Fe2+-enterobactin transport system substrate-binding protein